MKKKWLGIVFLSALVFVSACAGTKDSASEENASVGTLLTLGNYKNVEVKAYSTEVTEEEIQSEIDYLLAANPATQEVEGKTVVEDGDMVNIDYTGYLDGELFDGGADTGYNLVIGSDSFIDGFEDGLIGKEVGGTYDLNLTFPENYHEELAGKDVVFQVKVNAIMEYVDAEWNDDFVKAHTTYASVDAYMEGTRAELQAYKEEIKAQNVWSAVIANSKFDCEDAVEEMESNMRTTYESMASMYGLDLETYLLYGYGVSMEVFEEQLKSSAEYEVKRPLVAVAIIEKENLTLSEEEYATGLEELVKSNGAESAETFEKDNGRETIEQVLLEKKALKLVADQAVEVE